MKDSDDRIEEEIMGTTMTKPNVREKNCRLCVCGEHLVLVYNELKQDKTITHGVFGPPLRWL